MKNNNFNDKLLSQLNQGMKLSKCRKCKCMLDALDTMNSYFLRDKGGTFSNILKQVNEHILKMEPIEYS